MGKMKLKIFGKVRKDDGSGLGSYGKLDLKEFNGKKKKELTKPNYSTYPTRCMIVLPANLILIEPAKFAAHVNISYPNYKSFMFGWAYSYSHIYILPGSRDSHAWMNAFGSLRLRRLRKLQYNGVVGY